MSKVWMVSPFVHSYQQDDHRPFVGEYDPPQYFRHESMAEKVAMEYRIANIKMSEYGIYRGRELMYGIHLGHGIRQVDESAVPEGATICEVPSDSALVDDYLPYYFSAYNGHAHMVGRAPYTEPTRPLMWVDERKETNQLTHYRFAYIAWCYPEGIEETEDAIGKHQAAWMAHRDECYERMSEDEREVFQTWDDAYITVDLDQQFAPPPPPVLPPPMETKVMCRMYGVVYLYDDFSSTGVSIDKLFANRDDALRYYSGPYSTYASGKPREESSAMDSDDDRIGRDGLGFITHESFKENYSFFSNGRALMSFPVEEEV